MIVLVYFNRNRVCCLVLLVWVCTIKTAAGNLEVISYADCETWAVHMELINPATGWINASV